jgi:hypothetical protein
MPPKQYRLRTLEADNTIQQVLAQGKEKWEFFIGTPLNQGGASGIHQIACDALVHEGLIRPEFVDQLRQLPSADFFTKTT